MMTNSVLCKNGRASVLSRNVGKSQKKLVSTLEKLSSGYKINRSADDAAGLTVSEKLRMYLTGFAQAQKNSQDGVRLLQVGEGALAEIHDMLNRAAALAEQSSNGVYEDEVDRAVLQKELEQICAEIDRISKNVNFNGVNLFQDDGRAYETSVTNTPQAQTLEGLLTNTETGHLNIIYVETEVKASQTGTGSPADTTLDLNVVGGGKLSQVLKTQIVPQTVQNILTYYPAFSHLQGSSIGIGLELYDNPSTSVLASVSSGIRIGSSMMQSYKLSVNVATLKKNNISTNESAREELEATIAHEMLHAFMFEAATAGMMGYMPGGTYTKDDLKFPDWFVEGMAQTASGPGNWLHSTQIFLSSSSSDADIAAAIKKNALASGTTASQYGIGYLACMYLGAVVAGGGKAPSTINASTISSGLNQLLEDVIAGTSLSDAIKNRTGGVFSSVADFQNKFNKSSSEIAAFTRNLLRESSSGRGGLVSGNLKDQDLTPNGALAGIHLFELDPTHNTVENIYPSDYYVPSGGGVNATGKPPQPLLDYGDFLISGATGGVVYNASTNTLEINASGNVRVSMKRPGVASSAKIVLKGGAGTVTLDNINCSSTDALHITGNAKIQYTGKNQFGGIKMNASTSAIFEGSGQIRANSFTSDSTNSVQFTGGAVIVGNGTGTIQAGSVQIDHASVAANCTGTIKNGSGNLLNPFDVDWTQVGTLNQIMSISTDGVLGSMRLDKNDPIRLWLDKGTPDASGAYPIHRVKFSGTNASGSAASCAIAVQWEPAISQFKRVALNLNPFTVTGGIEGIDWKFDDNTKTLEILTGKSLTISGGIGTGIDGEEFSGRIAVKDGIGTANLTLNGVTCDVSNANTGYKERAFYCGKNNNVTLTIADNTTNTFISGKSAAGISVDSGTNLVIEGNNGKLRAESDKNYAGGAGIGSDSSWATRDSKIDRSITINGGDITAIGHRSSGIGAGFQFAQSGHITINGGTIHASSYGGNGIDGAGIGCASDGLMGDIKITGGTIFATENNRWGGAAIGGGRWDNRAGGNKDAYIGTITISGGEITAVSTSNYGTGIGVAAQGQCGKITITGNAIIHEATGGQQGTGIGAASSSVCEDIEISGNAKIEKASGKVGIGASGQERSSYPTIAGNIVIDTTNSVYTTAEKVGIGCPGFVYSSENEVYYPRCKDIIIKQGTIYAQGNETGIGARKDSASGNIIIGDSANPNKKVVVSAVGGMSHNGGNILSYTDWEHNTAGNITITGQNTTVRTGLPGEGLYSTSGVVDENGKNIYAYPLYLLTSGSLDASTGLTELPLPSTADLSTIKITAKGQDGTVKTWTPGLSHSPLDENYDFIWMTGQNQTLTIDYTNSDGSTGQAVLDLTFYADSGVFRIGSQEKPDPAVKPEFPEDPPPSPPDPPTPPINPDPPIPPTPPAPDDPKKGGILLQIGATAGEALEIPQFYLSLNALQMNGLDISTQENAWKTMPVLQSAIHRVSDIRGTYGALGNRLEYNIQNLGVSKENFAQAESLIRDADMAEEMKNYTLFSILSQMSQAMLAQGNQNAQKVLQLLQ